MTGLAVFPDRSLSERVLERLASGPSAAMELCVSVLGLLGAPVAVAERVVIALLGADPRVRQLGDGRWALAGVARGEPLIEECAFAVVDVETTGSRSAGDDRITEIAVVLVQGERRETILDTLVNPGRFIPPRVTMVTGITNEMVRAAPPFEDVVDTVLAALAGRVFVAHHARFDWSFIESAVRRVRGLSLSGPRLCTVRLTRRLFRGRVASCGLDALQLFFGIENRARHRAGGDAEATAQLLERLVWTAKSEGARTLADLEAIQFRRRRRVSSKR